MRHLLNLLLIAIFVTSLSGCISSSGGGEEGSSASSSIISSDSLVTLNFSPGDTYAMNNTGLDMRFARIIDFITMAKTAYAATLTDYITSVSVIVTGIGMSDITHVEDILNPSASFSVSMTIPNGTDRKFEIKLRDRDGNVLYDGELIINVGDYQGTPQDITVAVRIDGDISADDYVDIGREHLENLKLEMAFIAFDTAVCIDADHYVANFFRGLTHLMLLVQKDDPDADVASPDADIIEMLNLYSGIDVYTDAITPILAEGDTTIPIDYTIIPDIYDVNLRDNLGNFFGRDWTCPIGITTDTAVNVIESTILPELDNAINDLAIAEADPVFYTTFTPIMHFELSKTIEVDRGDIYILEALAYGLKAYYNHLLAYQWRTEIDYWKDNLDPPNEADYNGIQEVLDNDLSGMGDFTGNVVTRLANAKAAYSTGLDKFKAGLQFIDGRSSVNKEGHIVNIADDDINISKVITNIDEAKAALSGVKAITSYDEYDDTTEDSDEIILDLSIPFSSSTAPSRASLPEFYYHEKSGLDIPVFDTNNTASSSNLIDVLTSVVLEIDSETIETLEDALQNELLPDLYKFNVPSKTIGMTGNRIDFTYTPSLNPVMFDDEDSENPTQFDLTKVYMAKDDENLYIGMEFLANPYTDTGALVDGDYLNYNLQFNAAWDDCNWHNAPVVINRYYDGWSGSWEWRLYSYGEAKGPIGAEEGLETKTGNIIEFKIPLSYIKESIDTYQQHEFPAGWDGKEIFVTVNFNCRISSDQWQDSTGECLANLEYE